MRSLWYQSPHLNISLLMCQFCAQLMVLRFCCTAEPLGGVRNLQVTDPTTSSLNVQWEAAEGNVRQYKVFYVPAAGGETLTVIETSGLELLKKTCQKTRFLLWNRTTSLCTPFCVHADPSIRQHLPHRAEEPGLENRIHRHRGPSLLCWRGTAHVKERHDL